MPVTPFHIAPGVLVKALLPGAFSLSVFAATQIVVDLETSYFALQGRWPAHRTLHTLPGALLVGLALAVISRRWRRSFRQVTGAATRRMKIPEAWHAAETSTLGVLAGALIGAIVASLLDALMHTDIAPFWPFSRANPLLGILDLLVLHGLCLLAGIAGVFLLARRMSRSVDAGAGPPGLGGGRT